MIILGFIAGIFLTYNSGMTILHQECIKGDKPSCIIEQRENIYKK
jgi:hypothetical protein